MAQENAAFDFERTIRFISSKRCENSSSQPIEDEVHEFRKNFEKFEIHIHSMGQYDGSEWYLRPEEIMSNVQVNKLTFQGNIKSLRRPFEFASTIKNLKKVHFNFGKKKPRNIDLGIPERIRINHSVTEFEISFDRKAYVQDSEEGKISTKNLIITSMLFAKKSFPSIKILKLYIPKTNRLKIAAEKFWEHYFQGVKFSYQSLIREECVTLAVGYDMPRNEANPRPLQALDSNLSQRNRRNSTASTISLSEKPLALLPPPPPPSQSEISDDYVLELTIGEPNLYSQSNFQQSPLIMTPSSESESEQESETDDSVIFVEDAPPRVNVEYERTVVAPSDTDHKIEELPDIKGKTLDELRNLEFFCRRPLKKRRFEEFRP